MPRLVQTEELWQVGRASLSVSLLYGSETPLYADKPSLLHL